MCIPMWKFFIGIRDFRRSVREMKTNLADIKSILNGTLAMSQGLEEVTSEFKNITEFYSRESKNALRDQLCTSMSTNAHEAFYHRDFFKHFKLTFEFEIDKLMEEYDQKTAQLAILDIIQHLKRKIKSWMLTLSEDEVKVRLLVELMLYMQERFSQYICDGTDIWPYGKNKRRASSIRIFCEKQYIIQAMEGMLTEHFNRDITEQYCYSKDSRIHDIVYRRRATRIRRFRQFLTSKIKIKKIGEYYREEISFMVNIDLKKASEEVWQHEEMLRVQCAEIVQHLRALPRHRFIDVLAEENVINLGEKLASLTVKSFVPETKDFYGDKYSLTIQSLLPKTTESYGGKVLKEFLTEKDVFNGVRDLGTNNDLGRDEPQDKSTEMTKLYGGESYLSENTLKSIPEVLCNNTGGGDSNCSNEITTPAGGSNNQTTPTSDVSSNGSGAHDHRSASEIGTNISANKPPSPFYRSSSEGDLNSSDCDKKVSSIIKLNSNEEDVGLKRLVKNEILGLLKKLNILKYFSRDRILYCLQRHQQILKLNQAFVKGDLSIKNLITEITETLPTAQSKNTNEEQLIIDPQLIYDDVEHIGRKVLGYVGRKSARYTIELIDHSHMMSSKVIDFLSNIHALYQYDLEPKCENIFLEKLVEIVALDLKEEEVNVLKNLIFAFTNNNKNRFAFLKRLEEKIPSTILKTLETGREVIEERGKAGPS